MGSPLWCAIISRPLVAACILEGDLAAAQAVFEAVPKVSGTGQGLAERPVLVAHVELALARGQGVEALGFVERLMAATPGLIDDLVVPRLWWLRALARLELGQLAGARADLDVAREAAVALDQRPLLWRIEVHRCRQFLAAGDEAAARVAYESGRSLIRALAAEVPDVDLCTQFQRQALGLYPREFSGADGSLF